MIEIVVVLALLAIVLQLSAPALVRWRARRQLEASLRGVGLALSRACAHAVASGRHHALVFDLDDATLSWRTVADGDGDGIRNDDLLGSVDRPIESPWVLSRHYPGILAGRPPAVPPVAGGAPGSGGLAFGRSPIVSCSPTGRARSGTLYLMTGRGDGGAVRVFGPSARISLWWWDPQRRDWVRID